MGTNRLLLPSDGQGLWTSFLSMIPACANTSTTFDSFECLRNVPVEEIVTAHAAAVATTVVGWTPVIDGPGGFIPDLPSKLMAEGHFSRIPFISGTNLDEGMFIRLGLLPFNHEGSLQVPCSSTHQWPRQTTSASTSPLSSPESQIPRR